MNKKQHQTYVFFGASSPMKALTYFPLMSFIAAGPNIELTCRKGVKFSQGTGFPGNWVQGPDVVTKGAMKKAATLDV